MGQCHIKEQLILVMLIETDFFLCVMLESIYDVCLFYLLSNCANIPEQVLADDHAANTVFILCVENFLMFHLEIYLAILAKGIAQNLLNILSEVLARSWHFGIFDIVGNDNFFRLAELGNFDGLYGLAFVGFDDDISLTNRVIPRLNI